jgi:hypothetical protein
VSKADRIDKAASGLCAGGSSRREFLGGILAAGVLVSGCAGEQDPAVPPDAALLAPLLAGERAAVTALATVAGAAAVRDQDRRHVARLRTVLAAMGATPDAPGPDPAPALERKQQNVYDYVAVLPQLADPDLRVLVMELAASEAEHLAALRLEAGEPAVPDAFAGFTPPELA